MPQACKEAEIVEQTYYRWRKEFGGLKVDQARRLKDLEQENAKLKRLVSELSLEKLVLKDIASVDERTRESLLVRPEKRWVGVIANRSPLGTETEPP